jgi:cobalt transporter subunit CbtB
MPPETGRRGTGRRPASQETSPGKKLGRRRRDGKEVSVQNSISQPATAAQSGKWPALLVLAFGLLIVWGAGFAYPSAIHNATHDIRHAFGLPCH